MRFVTAGTGTATLLVQNSTFTGNIVKLPSAATTSGTVTLSIVATGTSDVKLVNNTIAYNTSEIATSTANGLFIGGVTDKIVAINNIIYSNTRPDNSDYSITTATNIKLKESRNNITSQAFNFAANTTTGASSDNVSSVAAINLGLAATLANNGGETQTLALSAGSSAINNGYATGAPSVDQRNVTRVGTKDVGAYEGPSITGAATTTAFTTTYGTASAAQNFSVSGTNLTTDLVATAPTGFEVSSDGTNYAATASFTPTSGSASGTLRIRLKANAAVSGTYNSQNIVLSSTNATSVNIVTAASGNAVTAATGSPTGDNLNNSGLSDAQLANTNLTISLGEFIINDTKTVLSLTVAPGAKLTHSSGTLTATNGITLESDANSTATLMDSYSSPTINATVKQHVTLGRNWYLSSPVSAAPFGWLNRGTSVQGWNEATKAWVPVTSGTLVRGKGYVQVATTIVSPASTTGTTGTVDVNGTTNSGDVAITVSRTEDGLSRGFNLVGNPYPSYLKWGTGENGFLADATNDSISTSFWYRTKNSSEAYVFTTYNGSSHLVVGGSTLNNNALNEYIPPMQAFWIRVSANTDVTTHNVVLKFKNNMRFHGIGDNNKFKAPKNEERKLLRLQLENGSQSDEALIYFDANAANTFDNYDSPKMMNNSSTLPDLYTTAGSERLAINGLYDFADNMELPLGFTLKAATTGLTLKVSELSNFASGTKVYLLDKEQHSQTELLPATEYTFNTSASTVNNESRFILLFRAPNTSTGLDNTQKSIAQVFVNAANQITIIAPEKSTYVIYNAMGQQVENGVTTAKQQTVNCNINTGVYVVKVGNQSTRVIVK
jgi:hypothetical protein